MPESSPDNNVREYLDRAQQEAHDKGQADGEAYLDVYLKKTGVRLQQGDTVNSNEILPYFNKSGLPHRLYAFYAAGFENRIARGDYRDHGPAAQ